MSTRVQDKCPLGILLIAYVWPNVNELQSIRLHIITIFYIIQLFTISLGKEKRNTYAKSDEDVQTLQIIITCYNDDDYVLPVLSPKNLIIFNKFI